MTTVFTFNGNYNDLEQVAPYLDKFLEVYEKVARNGFAYNDDFLGRIPGIANPEPVGPNRGTHEGAAIYLLQGLKRQREQDAKVATLLSLGYEWVNSMECTQKFGHVILVPRSRMGGEWREYHEARVVPDVATRLPWAVLPKGARTNGHAVQGRKVLVVVRGIEA